MPIVFLSYRRADSRDVTGRLYDCLSDEFGEANVFRDVDSIPLGADFRTVIRDKVSSCDLFIAMVGPNWMTAMDDQGRRRLNDPDDFVRLEVEAALRRGVPVFVVLTGSTPPPVSTQLPHTLAALPACPPIRLRPDPDFGTDFATLVKALRRAPPPPTRTLQWEERWAEIRRHMAIGAAMGAAVGAITGGALMFAAAGNDSAPVAASVLLPAVGGGAFGWRSHRWWGLPVGLVAGLIGGIGLIVLIALITMLVGAPVMWIAGHGKVQTPHWQDSAGISAGFAAATMALVAGLVVMRGRKRTSGMKVALASAAAYVGTACLVELIAWQNLRYGRYDATLPSWLQHGLLAVSLPAATAAFAGALLGTQSGWQRRRR